MVMCPRRSMTDVALCELRVLYVFYNGFPVHVLNSNGPRGARTRLVARTAHMPEAALPLRLRLLQLRPANTLLIDRC